MPRPDLWSLPLEVFENVLSRLELDEVRTLRLTGNGVATKAAHYYYVALFRRKTICLTSHDQIEEFVRKTEPGETGCYVQHLTLKLVVPCERILSHDDCTSIAQHLAKALVKLRRLQCLALEIEFIEKLQERIGAMGGRYTMMDRIADWEQVLQAAVQTFTISCQALEISGLCIDEVDAFGPIRACSLTCNHIRDALDMKLTPSFGNLKRLSLSLSGGIDGDGNTARNIDGICRLLQMCPKLETLEVHWFQLPDEETEGERRFFDRVADTVQLPQLRRLSLKGIKVCADVLVQFFSNSPLLAELIMGNIRLHTGSYNKVFASITHQLDYLDLDNLFADKLMYFDVPGEPYFPSVGGAKKGPNYIVREGAQARRPIRFCAKKIGRPYGSAAVNNWRRRMMREYGPPEF